MPLVPDSSDDAQVMISSASMEAALRSLQGVGPDVRVTTSSQGSGFLRWNVTFVNEENPPLLSIDTSKLIPRGTRSTARVTTKGSSMIGGSFLLSHLDRSINVSTSATAKNLRDALVAIGINDVSVSRKKQEGAGNGWIWSMLFYENCPGLDDVEHVTDNGLASVVVAHFRRVRRLWMWTEH